MRHIWTITAAATLGATVLTGSLALAASDYPKQSITVVIPTRPGGSADQTIQPLKTLMEKELGVTLLYSYKRLIPLAPVGSTGGGLDATRAAARPG